MSPGPARRMIEFEVASPGSDEGAAMKTFIRSLIVACVASLTFAAGASTSAQTPPFSMTKQITGVPCSVTATFALNSATATMNYSGGVSCAGGAGQKVIDVVPQVFNVVNGQPLWFDLSLSGLYQGPTPVNPLRLSSSRSAVASHIYRVLVYAHVAMPDGRTSAATVCANCADYSNLTTYSSYTYAPQGPTTVPMQGVPGSTITASGPVFTLVNGSYVVTYGGYASCNEKVRHMSMTISVQTPNQIAGRTFWFTITGSTLSLGASSAKFVELSTARTAYLGHGYRTVVFATCQYTGAHGTVIGAGTAYSPGWGP